MSSRTIYILMAQQTYTHAPAKVLQAFTDEVEATKMKLMIEDCGPKYEIVVTKATLVDTGAKPVALKPMYFYPGENMPVGASPPTQAPTSANNLAEFAQQIHDDAEA